MRITKGGIGIVDSTRACEVRVRCDLLRHSEIKQRLRKHEGRWFILAEGFANLDGNPYEAFYCADCTRTLMAAHGETDHA